MKRILLAAASLAAIAAVALPASAHGPGQRGGGPGPDMMRPDPAELDTNGDGAVSKDEIKAHREAMFAEIDTNHDGVLSQDEIVAHHEMKKAEMRAKMQAKMFARLDADGNGTVSKEEFEDRPMPMFDRMDDDGDGVVMIEEFEDGPMMRKEVRRYKWIEKDKPATPDDN